MEKIRRREELIRKLGESIIHLDDTQREELAPDFKVVEKQLKQIMIDK